MTGRRTPLYQAVIQRLPLKRMEVAEALGALAGRKVEAVVNQARYRLDLRELIQRSMFLGLYEPDQTAWFRQCLRPGDVVLDVGASFGYYTTLASLLVGPRGRVFAFEPSPVAGGTVEQAVAESGIGNVVLTKAAAGARNGSITLYMPNTEYLHSPSILQSDETFAPLEVPIIALDQFAPLRDVPRVRLVKIDVEGYEPDVLKGMEGLVRERRIENIICEFNSGWLRRNATTPEQLMERFLGLGYEVHARTRFQKGLVGRNGEVFDLQDIWFALRAVEGG